MESNLYSALGLSWFRGRRKSHLEPNRVCRVSAAVLSCWTWPKPPCMTCKGMRCCGFDGKGMIHKRFVSRGQTVEGDFYTRVLRRLRDRVRFVRLAIKGDWILHNNEPAHMSRAAMRFWPSSLWHHCRRHPRALTRLSSKWLFPLPLNQDNPKSKRFDSINTVQQASTRVLDSMSSDDFQRGYEQWKTCWQCCVDAGGSYFEEF